MEFTRVTSYTQRTIQALQAAGPFGLSGNARNIILAQDGGDTRPIPQTTRVYERRRCRMA
jgi:hypothetical protein